MKILYYNWIPFDNPGNKGGGVTVYQKNLIEYMIRDPKNTIFFLSSGREYRGFGKKAYIKETTNIFGEKCHSFIIVNSPILATGDYLNPIDLQCYLKEESLHFLIRDFIKMQGGFDVIHFNNFEGLSLNVLKIKEDFPKMRILYSLHNYYPFCTQVNLWKHQSEHCFDYKHGIECIHCHIDGVYSEKIKKKIVLNYLMQKYPHFISIFHWYEHCLDKKYARKKFPVNKKEHRVYIAYRKKNIAFINQYVDVILAVSKRTMEIAIRMGIDTEKIYADYIGTKFAEHQITIYQKKKEQNIFTLIYMGYMRKEKGFYFFLEACEIMDNDLAGKCHLIFASEITDSSIKQRMEQLKHKFYKVTFYCGYTHDNIQTMLKTVDLGIVPVLWEDNLPQIAIEMVCFGVPILTSNLGGAQELTEREEFQFEAGNFTDFQKKLRTIIEHKELLSLYFKDRKPLTTMEQHIKRLYQYYQPN